MNTTKINYPLPEGWYICGMGGGFYCLAYDTVGNTQWIISKCDDRVETPDTIYDKCELHLQNDEETFIFFECETVMEAFSIFQKSCRGWKNIKI